MGDRFSLSVAVIANSSVTGVNCLSNWLILWVNCSIHGQAKILTPEEIQLLFSEGLVTPCDRAGREMNLLRMEVRREREGGEKSDEGLHQDKEEPL